MHNVVHCRHKSITRNILTQYNNHSKKKEKKRVEFSEMALIFCVFYT